MYQNSRELFEAAHAASMDAAKISKELEALDERAARVGTPSLEPHGRGTRDADPIGRRVAHKLDREKILERRLEEDYRLIDSACWILYGEDGISDGLASIAPPWWADAIYHHYLALRTWDEVAELVMFSKRYVLERVGAAFDLMDANGMASTVEGRRSAEG